MEKYILELINYYKAIYKRKNAIESDEEIDKKIVLDVIKKIQNSVQDYQTTMDILKKAVVYYLYQHDNTTQDGGQFPYQLKILLEQGWLLRKCIESSRSTNLELLLKAQESGISTKDLSRAIKRGDIAGIDSSEKIPALLEEALIRIETFIKDYPLKLKREFKKHPKIKDLYTSTLPTSDYIRKAMKFIEKAEMTNE